MAFLYITRTALRKELWLMRSYAFNTAMQVLVILFIFAALYLGVRWLTPAHRTASTLDALIVGYWIWGGMITALSRFTFTLSAYASQGILEQLFMTPLGLVRILAAEAIAGFLVGVAFNGGILLLLMLMTGRWLSFEPLTLLGLYTLTLLPLYGVGYALAGLALRYKNVQQAFNLVQFLVLPLEILPVDRHPWLNVFPVAQGVRMLLEHVREGTRLWEFPLSSLLILLAHSVVYLAMGLAVYLPLERASRRRGLLAHY